jgi:hypothetical protein
MTAYGIIALIRTIDRRFIKYVENNFDNISKLTGKEINSIKFISNECRWTPVYEKFYVKDGEYGILD